MLKINEDFLSQHNLHFPMHYDENKLIFIGDLEHRVVGANQYTANTVGLNKLNDLIEDPLYYGELPCKAKFLADSFIKEDKQVGNNFEIVNTIARVGYAKNEFKLLLSEKIPLVNRNRELIGYSCSSINITNSQFVNLHPLLNELNSAPVTQGQFSLILKDKYTDMDLSSRETECLFYFMRGNSCSRIANILNLSRRTIEMYIDNVKHKMHCQNKQELIENSISRGFTSIIPKKILNRFEKT